MKEDDSMTNNQYDIKAILSAVEIIATDTFSNQEELTRFIEKIESIKKQE
ncbi:MAG: hypothetical protein NC177_17970 [Ruminococcus flavefaciens]|nr:hypothetical protein [Ruminococcus flavefaciens]